MTSSQGSASESVVRQWCKTVENSNRSSAKFA